MDKFTELINFLKTVPSVEPTKEEIDIMKKIDEDVNEQQRIKELINKRKNEFKKGGTII